MRIDVHAHYFPPAYLEQLERAGRSAAGALRRGAGGGTQVEDRLELLDRAAIDCQVLSVGAQVPYLPRAADAAEAARLANDLLAEVCARYPRRFAAFATVPLPHIDAALTEVRRGLDELGLVGVNVGCSIRGVPLEDPAFAPLFEELDHRATVLALHPVGAGGGPASSAYGLRWTIGGPVEDTISALRLVLSGWSERYPRIQVIVPHLGGTLPFLFQRLDDETQRQRRLDPSLATLPEQPAAALRRFWFDTVNRHPAALRCAAETLGSDRLLLGTDYPYLSGDEFVDCVEYVERSLPAAEAEQVMGSNPARLLGLPGD